MAGDEEDLVMRRHVHVHVEIPLEWTYRSVRLLPATVNTDGREFAHHSCTRVSEEEKTRIVRGPCQVCQTAGRFRRQHPAAAHGFTDDHFVVTRFSCDESPVVRESLLGQREGKPGFPSGL